MTAEPNRLASRQLAGRSPAPTVAALYVIEGGCYAHLEGVEPWGETRDARRYDGPWPVIGHPPCQRWGKYHAGSPRQVERRQLGDDGGCFAACLASVRRWGGVLEHPFASKAWDAFDLIRPPISGGWVVADWQGGWTCAVDQRHYGHEANKMTMLYAVAPSLPSLRWGKGPPGRCIENLNKRKREATPPEFRDLLIEIARSRDLQNGGNDVHNSR